MLKILRLICSEIECGNLIALHDAALWDLACFLRQKASWIAVKGTFSQNPGSTFLIFPKIEPRVPS